MDDKDLWWHSQQLGRVEEEMLSTSTGDRYFDLSHQRDALMRVIREKRAIRERPPDPIVNENIDVVAHGRVKFSGIDVESYGTYPETVDAHAS